MNIYALINASDIHASYYYRMIVPLRTMEDLGLPVTVIVDPMTTDVPTEKRRDGLVWSDIVWTYQATDPLLRHNISATKRMKAQHGDDGKVWHPANYIVDTDDDLFNVLPTSWAFRRLGVKNLDGEYLHPNCVVPVLHEDGAPMLAKNQPVMWEDGKDGFNVVENIERLENYRMLCETAGTMTCSTPATEAYIKREMSDMQTFVNPNAVRFDHYVDVPLAPHKEVRIMWQGSNTHYEDFYHIHKALPRLAKKYPQAKFIFWGEKFESLTDSIPREQFEYIPWMPYNQYHLRLVTVGPDINICPLAPTAFGSSRSGIKFYEASLLHTPAATVAQRTGAYANEIIHDQTGLLFDNETEFEEQVSRLIEDETKRKELAANAKDWVHEERDAFKLAPKLFEFFQSVRESRKAVWPVQEKDVQPVLDDIRNSEKPSRGSRRSAGKPNNAGKGGRKRTTRAKVLEQGA